MNQIEFDPKAFGLPASDDHGGDVCCAGCLDPAPRMMLRKVVVDPDAKVVRLADVYRVVAPVVEPGKDIDAGERVEFLPKGVVVKFVARSALPRPIDEV